MPAADADGVDASELLGVLHDMEAADFSGAMAEVANLFVSAVSDKFDAEGPGWAPLAASTLRQRRGAHAQILQDTGRLAGSIFADSGADFAEAATDVSYAGYHVSDAPRTRLPLRDFFDLPDAVLEEAEDIILAAVIG